MLEAPFIFEIITILSWLFGYVEKRLTIKLWLISKFGQLIEYTMKNIFLEKLYTKCGQKTSPRPFYKNLEFSISLDQQPEML